jgi:hypothetical protein
LQLNIPSSLQVMWHDAPVSAIHKSILPFALDVSAKAGQFSETVRPKFPESLVDDGIGAPAIAALAASRLSRT